jgi:hypothetical protein
VEIKCQLDATDEFLLQMCVRFAGCSPQTGHTTLNSTLYRQLENQAPNATGSNHLHNTLELLKMGIMVPETCWASKKICNKNSSVASSWHFISTYYRRCTVKTTSNSTHYFQNKQGLFPSVHISGPHSGAAEGMSLLACDALSLGVQSSALSTMVNP